MTASLSAETIASLAGSATNANRITGTRGDKSALEKVAQDFEAMTLQNLMGLVTQSVDLSDTPFGGGAGERAFQPMLTEQYAKGFTQNGGIGIAHAVLRELMALQEQSGNGLPTSTPAA